MRALVLLAVFGALVVLAITGRLSERSFTFHFLLYLDMFVCALCGRPDMTISSSCGLAIRWGWPWYAVALGRGLNTISKNHCENAIADDIARARRALDILLGDS